MSNKGKVFTDADLPRLTQQRLKNGQVQKAEREFLTSWLDAQTERNRIVAKMEDGTPLIAEELAERAMRVHASGDGHVLATLRLLTTQLSEEQRAAVLEAFDKKGALKVPFKKA